MWRTVQKVWHPLARFIHRPAKIHDAIMLDVRRFLYRYCWTVMPQILTAQAYSFVVMVGLCTWLFGQNFFKHSKERLKTVCVLCLTKLLHGCVDVAGPMLTDTNFVFNLTMPTPMPAYLTVHYIWRRRRGFSFCQYTGPATSQHFNCSGITGKVSSLLRSVIFVNENENGENGKIKNLLTKTKTKTKKWWKLKQN